MNLSPKNQTRLQKYAKLVFKVGLAFKEGMKFSIRVEPESYEYALEFAKAAYNLGAAFVQIDIKDLELQKYRTLVQSEKQLKFYPEYLEYYDRQRIDEKWGILTIETTESFDKLNGADSEKNIAYIKALKRYQFSLNTATQNSIIPWCIVCLPGKNWAKKILGNEDEEELWDIIASILYLDEIDPVKKWLEISNNLKTRCQKLNQLHIKKLYYHSKFTDFSIGLHQNALWQAGCDRLQDAREFMPNLPSYEVYTAPLYKSAEGVIKTTRPSQVLDGICKEIEFTFSQGRVVKAICDGSQEAIDKYLCIDKGTSYIGEVALVDNNNSINKSLKIFSTILYDENASCHIALGSSYPECVKGGNEAKSDKEKYSLGLNLSIMHTDFMIGSDDLNIDADLYDGGSVKIMNNGKLNF